METVVLDGVKYVKASVVAKEFRYTSDYIGQLCRGKKVDARLVGRSWFVNPDSIIAHKKGKYSNLKPEKNVAESESKASTIGATKIPIESNVKTERRTVAPVIKNKTMKALYESAAPLREVNEDGSKKLHVLYEADQEVLYPKITKKKTRPPKTLKVNHAEGRKIHISTNKTELSFEVGELPDVALSGTLSVSGIEEPSETTEELERKAEEKARKDAEKAKKQMEEKHKTSLKNKAISAKSINERMLRERQKGLVKVAVRNGEPKKGLKVKVKKQPSKSTDEKARIRAMFRSVSDDMSREKTMSPQKSPVLVSKQPKSPENHVNIAKVQPQKTVGEVKFASAPVEVAQPVKISFAVLASPLIASILALVCVTVLFSASSTVVVTQSNFTSEVVLQVANLLELLK